MTSRGSGRQDSCLFGSSPVCAGTIKDAVSVWECGCDKCTD